MVAQHMDPLIIGSGHTLSQISLYIGPLPVDTDMYLLSIYVAHRQHCSGR